MTNDELIRRICDVEEEGVNMSNDDYDHDLTSEDAIRFLLRAFSLCVDFFRSISQLEENDD